MTHQMNLHPQPFSMIADGRKTVELRLYDEKRRLIEVGDDIIFICTQPPYDTLRAEVVRLYRYDSFGELYANLPLLSCGYTEEDISSAKPEDMELYYTPEQQTKYGVVGIEIQLK